LLKADINVNITNYKIDASMRRRKYKSMEHGYHGKEG
jgi:hypothetical protein